ncbi:MAG TPA: response regulator [Methylomirabilota bacterium]
MKDVVLVVDDERDLALTCRRLLMRGGWQVTTVGSRGAALEALEGGAPPALAIVDRLLPDGDGLDVVRAARTQGTPAIVMSALTSAANRAQTREAGAAGFLGKPFSARDFLDLVRTVAGEPPQI